MERVIFCLYDWFIHDKERLQLELQYYIEVSQFKGKAPIEFEKTNTAGKDFRPLLIRIH
jgi:hypothetical protein